MNKGFQMSAGSMFFKVASSVLATTVLAFSAYAEQSADKPKGLLDGDAEAGAAKAAPCVACHGVAGNSVSPEWPKLAGQGAKYTYGQLKAFKEGERTNPIMAGQVANLSDQDMKDISVYFSEQQTSLGAANPDLVEAGEAVFRGGNKETDTPACIGCHGPRGLGNAAASYPRIAGQQATYVANQLKAYRAGERANSDLAKMMVDAADRLTDEEIKALASYLQGLH